MARRGRPNANAGKALVKLLVALLLAVVVAVFAVRQHQKSQLLATENQAVAHCNRGQYDQAIQVYEDLIPRLSDAGDKDRVRRQLAQCWKAKGDDPQLSLKEQVGYYKKALAHDPGCITNKVILDAIERDK